MTIKKIQILLILPLLLLTLGVNGQSAMDQFKGMKIRNIGPAGMSGRVTAIDAVHSNPDIIYAGTASGGLWKSEGGGVAWKPIFDQQKVHSIGAVAIDQNNPDVVWVGTGEGNPRNSMSSGGGIFKSLDGGNTWTLMGLEATRNIHRIIVHRDNPNVVYVAAIGNAWYDSEDRGVYKTTDGGKTWNKVLYVNNRTGAADFVVDPSNPNKMFVNMWEFRRWPYFFKSGGEGSGLYVTLDGGETWTKRTEADGIPAGNLGKVGLAIAQSNPKVVYALIESKKNGLYKSEDGGFKWKLVQNKDIGDRPFYYADIAVDPENENRLYNVFSNVKVSEDGGKTFKTLLGWDNIHGDHHFWWINPQDGNMMMDGNDGGMAISRDRGKTWRFIENLPVAQFYHIRVDNEIPYNVMGGMQDNGTWRGPAYSLRKGGIRNGYWEEIGFGDGFDVLVDHEDPNKGFVMWQEGNLQFVDFVTGAQRNVRPAHPEGEFLRFNWNAGIARDPQNPDQVYYGSQYLHRSTDRGASWQIISPDLTTNNPDQQNQRKSGGLTYDVTGAENYNTILGIAPSPLEDDVIWVSTDDGNIQLTQDGGDSWNLTNSKVKDFPTGAWIPQIHASKYNKGEAFAVVNDYRRGNWTPYLYHTSNYGKTWTNLLAGKDIWGYSLSFVQDPVEPNLMFLGTEFGLYVSLDGGSSWNSWKNGYPTASTMDLALQERERDLVIGTFGRSAWVLDDIQPLREAASTKDLMDKDMHVFAARDAHLFNWRQARGTRFHGDAIYRGEDRPFGALVNVYIKSLGSDDKGEAKKADTAMVNVSNAQGDVIRTFKAPVTAGVSRFYWDLTRKGVRFPSVPKKPGATEPNGPMVLPGTYTVSVTYGDFSGETTVKVEADPRVNVDMAELQETDAAITAMMTQIERITLGMDQLRSAGATMKSVMAKAGQEDEEQMKSYKELSKGLKTQMDSIIMLVTKIEGMQGIYRNPDQLEMQLGRLSFYFNNPLSGPSFPFGTPKPPFTGPGENYKPLLEVATKDVDEFINQVNAFISGPWKDFENKVKSDGIMLFDSMDALK